MPPAPSGDRTSYGPSRVPAGNVMRTRRIVCLRARRSGRTLTATSRSGYRERRPPDPGPSGGRRFAVAVEPVWRKIRKTIEAGSVPLDDDPGVPAGNEAVVDPERRGLVPADHVLPGVQRDLPVSPDEP